MTDNKDSSDNDSKIDTARDDVSAAESAVAEAERKLQNAQQKLEEAQQKLEEVKEELDKATEDRMKVEEQLEKMQQCTEQVRQLQEQTQTELSTRLSVIDNRIETATARLKHAEVILQDYINTNQPARDFHDWITYQPKNKSLVTPDQLNARLSMNGEQLPHFVDYLSIRDTQFRKNLELHRQNYANAKNDIERHNVQISAQKNMSGLLNEKIAEYGLKPYGTKVLTQNRTYFDDGRYTKTDLKVEGLTVPLILGRGDRMGAQINGSLAVEVKSGKSDYLYSQKEHLVFQAGGHQEASTSMVLCSRDIKDLSPEKEQELRNACRQAGSPIIGMLPRKSEIDETLWNAVTGRK
ncbi:MAG: hypothetical protein LBC20_09620 [Planctomycetaceae bacterium]|nr:hypothetical protein [Planctomycetaceae bacterium]